MKTPYKGAPTPAIDEAWNAIVPLYLIRIPAAAIPHLNKSATAATFPGSSDYLGTVDAFHQLHCVNLVRKYTYADYYKDIDIAWRDPPDMLRTHVDHCIDVLRQKIMCDADVCKLLFLFWLYGWKIRAQLTGGGSGDHLLLGRGPRARPPRLLEHTPVQKLRQGAGLGSGKQDGYGLEGNHQE